MIKEVIRYIASDGKEFLYKTECLAHEEIIKHFDILKDNIVMLDGDCCPIKDIEQDFAETCYLYIKTDEAAIVLNDIMRDTVIMPWDQMGIKPCAGIFVYDNDTENWMDFKNLKRYIARIERYKPSWA